jgi:hypothetical protein
MKIELTQIKVEGWNLDVDSNFQELHKIYKYQLCTDDWWHFFREGDYTLIRCLNENVHEVSKLLQTEHGITPEQIHVTKPWVDNIEITKEYQEEFTYMFHAFSVLAMKSFEREDTQSPYEMMSDFMHIFDRVVHCFLNVGRSHKKVQAFKPFMPVKKDSHVAGIWESMLITHNALMRMYTLGTFSGQIEMQDTMEKLLEKKKDA